MQLLQLIPRDGAVSHLMKFVPQLREEACQEDLQGSVAYMLHEGCALHHLIQVAHPILIHLQGHHDGVRDTIILSNRPSVSRVCVSHQQPASGQVWLAELCQQVRQAIYVS